MPCSLRSSLQTNRTSSTPAREPWSHVGCVVTDPFPIGRQGCAAGFSKKDGTSNRIHRSNTIHFDRCVRIVLLCHRCVRLRCSVCLRWSVVLSPTTDRALKNNTQSGFPSKTRVGGSRHRALLLCPARGRAETNLVRVEALCEDVNDGTDVEKTAGWSSTSTRRWLLSRTTTFSSSPSCL